MATAQAEYRFPLRGRTSAVLFAATGDVSNGWRNFETGAMKLTGGAGLRYLIDPNEKVNVRLDVGLGREGGQLYFQLGEAF